MVTASAWAQISQGWITGRVCDAVNSRGLQGVRLILTRLADKATRAASTDSSGGYHFLALYPGTYDLVCEKPGYAATTIHLVRVASSRASIADVTMGTGATPVSIRWQGSPEDLWAADYGSYFDATRLALIPSARNIWAVLESQERSTITNAPQEGGFATGVIALAGSLGASRTQVSYRLDGLNVTDPFETGKPLVFPDYGALQELQASTALHTPEIAAPGASLNMTSRESARDFHFGVEGYYLGEPFQSSNLDSRLRGFGFTDVPHFKRFEEGQFQFGGALPRTRRWSFFTSFGIQHLTRVVPGFPSIPDTTVSSALVRFDGRLGAREQFNLLSTGQIVDNSNLGARSGVAPSSTLRGHDRFEVVQGHWTHYQGGDLVWQVLGGFSHSSPTDTLQHGIAAASRIQLFTGETAGAAPLESDSARSRFSLAGQGEAWRRFLGRQHQLDFGLDLEESKSTEERRIFGDFQQLYYPFGVPAEVVEYNTPSHSKQRLRELSLYLDERVHVTGRIFVRAGLLLDSSKTFLPPQRSGAGAFVPARQFPGMNSIVSWTTLAPRIGVSMPLSRRLGGARLSAGYARYYHVLPASYANFANPTSLGGQVFLWNDLNHDGFFHPGEEGTLLRVFGGPYSSVDPRLKRPFTDEFAIGLDQQIGERLSLEARGFRRDQKRLIETVNVGVPFSSCTPVSVSDAGDDNIPGTSDDQTLTVLNQDPSTLGEDRYLLANPLGLRSSYKGLEITVHWEFAQRGFFSASFTAYKAIGTTNPGNTEFENDPGIIGGLFDNPNNLLNARGRTFFDRAYVGKVASYVRLPFGFYSGSAIRYADGLPFGRKLIITGFNQGPFYILATPRGEPGGFRTQFDLSFDQRLARDFALGRFRVSAMVDAFNLLNSNRNLREYDISGPLFTSRTPVEIQNPRAIRFGLRLNL
ncbi:MAG: carboxypeptidase regulatory-like domain-containing protein [Acidobacteriia bacterium]|nr:carboxypeptidase regulatory-like domain-containing protein [Terriglobia bacterium]